MLIWFKNVIPVKKLPISDGESFLASISYLNWIRKILFTQNCSIWNFNPTDLLNIFPSDWRNDLITYKRVKKIKKTRSIYNQKFLDSDNPGKIFGTQLKNLVKLDRIRKVRYLLLHVFWLPLPKLSLCKGDWALDYASTQIWDFSKISLLRNITSLKSFGISSGNFCANFVLLVIISRFTCSYFALY